MPVSERLTFNPELRRLGIPETLPDKPVGAKDEIEGFGLDPVYYPSCSKPIPNQNRGCQHFNTCPFSYKGKSLNEGGGPRRHGFELVQRGKPVRRFDSECFSVVPKIEDIQSNQGALRVIADEGETYEKVEGVYIKTFIDAESGETTKVVAKEGEYHYPNVARGDMLVTKKVLPFTRTEDNKDIAVDIVTATVVAKEQERIRGEAFPNALGLEVGGTPLDKRNRRGSKSKGQSE